MKKTLTITIAAVLATATTLGALTLTGRLRAQDAANAEARRVDRDVARAVRDVEVMRRILAKEALGATSRTDPMATVAWHARYALDRATQFGGSGSSEAFFVEGQGAIFILRTSDPVTPPTGDPTATPEEKPTLWDSTLADVEGHPRRYQKADQNEQFDREKVRSLEDRILTQFARFGARMSGLRAQDSITVVVVGRGGGRSAVAYLNAFYGPGDESEPDESPATVYLSGTGRSVRTIRVGMGDIQSVANSGGGAEALRARATIQAY